MVTKVIPYGKQNITEEDILAVKNALVGDYLTQGPTILEFEQKFAEYIGCKYAVSVSNGTAALHLAAIAVGIEKNDKVITTPITFAASANCIRYCEGEVIFSDIDKNTYLLDLEKLEIFLNSLPSGTIKGVIAVDFAGRAINLEKLKNICNKFNIWIIEDACHAPGGFFIDSIGNKQRCGNGNFADLAVFSFHPVKHIACGEGGMITTNNEKLYKKLLSLRTHGITKNQNEFVNDEKWISDENNINRLIKYPTWYMEMHELGYNYRFTDFQAALGISQLKRAELGIIRRHEIAKKYDNFFKDKVWVKGHSKYVEGHAYHLYVIEIEDRQGLYDYLKSKNIHAQVHYIPTHLMPYYKKFGWKYGDLPVAEAYFKRCLSLPMYPTLKEEEQEYILKELENFFNV
jgi:UDP-4-amino-4,6-dideoxy-N-acetyl-beta-L-altrosamine transaminase